jgi:hypothetical protein
MNNPKCVYNEEVVGSGSCPFNRPYYSLFFDKNPNKYKCDYVEIWDYKTVYECQQLLSKIFQRGLKGYIVRLLRTLKYYVM